MSATDQIREDPRLNRIFDLSLELLCIIDFEGTIKVLNPAVMRMLGYEQHQLVGLKAAELVHPDDLPELQSRMERLVRGEQIASFETRFRHRDNTWRWLLWNAAPSLPDGVIYAAASDITEKKKYLEQRFRRLFETAKDGMVLLNAESGVISDV